MAHQRQLIREAVSTALTGATSAGARVYRSREIPHRKAELPVVNIYTKDETVDEESRNYAPRELQRTMSLALQCWVAVTDERADDAMDAIAAEVEDAMHADFYLGATAADSLLSSTTLQVFDDGDRQLGMIEFVYTVLYRTVVPTPTATVDRPDYTTSGVTYTADTAEAEDLVTVQEPE